MKIKQQKKIKVYLIQEFGDRKGNSLFSKQETRLNDLIENTKGKTDNQMKMLIQTILPRLALYQTLQEDESSKKDAVTYMCKYMIDIVAAKKHASTEKMEKVPGFYSILAESF